MVLFFTTALLIKLILSIYIIVLCYEDIKKIYKYFAIGQDAEISNRGIILFILLCVLDIIIIQSIAIALIIKINN